MPDPGVLVMGKYAAGDPFVSVMIYRKTGEMNVGFVAFFMSYIIVVVCIVGQISSFCSLDLPAYYYIHEHEVLPYD